MPSRVWEKELSKTLDITWGDASKALKRAKKELDIDDKEYPEERKDEVFAKCKEIVNSDGFVQSKKVEMVTREAIQQKGLRTSSTTSSKEGFEDGK